MPDHVHLFAASIVGIALPSSIQSLSTTMGKRLLLLEMHKPHWQDGFFDHLLRSYESYAPKWEYVGLNPVRAKLCQTSEAWRIKVRFSRFDLISPDAFAGVVDSTATQRLGYN